jgi:hypothetical protein
MVFGVPVTFKNGFYPGLHLPPDGTIIGVSHATDEPEDIG